MAVALKPGSGEDLFDKGKSTSIVDTPEFKEAVKRAAAEATAEIVASLRAQNGAGPVDESVKSLFDQLALSIAEISHQGDKRDRPVDPKIIVQREAALVRMTDLLVKARDLPREEMPRYRVISKCYFGERIINPFRQENKVAVPVVIRWMLEPNDALRPANDAAKAIYAEFRASRGDKSKIEKAAMKPLWMTDHGLIVEGEGPTRREGFSQIVARPAEFDDDLDIPAAHDPTAPFIHVLGTLAEPARQNYQGKPLD